MERLPLLLCILFLAYADPAHPPSPTPAPFSSNPFRPTIAVIVGVFTTLFSLTFLLLLYARHCKPGGPAPGSSYNAREAAARKNSGIDRSVIESLPIFRFASLRGQKEGLECAVCLARFESVEVLRLLPKCNHAFHVECVDTWLDAHSTCPLCRYRVDPEDVLLTQFTRQENRDPEGGFRVHRISGRHSSAGERGSAVVPPGAGRKSLDSSGWRSKAKGEVGVGVRCCDRQRRKDGLLLGGDEEEGARVEHRIVVSEGVQQRWSDLQASDRLYLRTEMIMNESGRSVINGRSVSEITGYKRFAGGGSNEGEGEGEAEGQGGVVSRWLAWISSRSQSQPTHAAPVPSIL